MTLNQKFSILAARWKGTTIPGTQRFGFNYSWVRLGYWEFSMLLNCQPSLRPTGTETPLTDLYLKADGLTYSPLSFGKKINK